MSPSALVFPHPDFPSVAGFLAPDVSEEWDNMALKTTITLSPPAGTHDTNAQDGFPSLPSSSSYL